MRETIASTWIYQLVIIFILMFVSFLVLSLTYSKNYKTKNEMISIIEKYEGVNVKSLQIINNYLSYNGYRVKGKCPSGENWRGIESLESTNLRKPESGKKYYYCINKKHQKADASSTSSRNATILKSKMYYQIKIFFKFNIPLLGEIYTFTVDGTTNDIFDGNDLYTTSR